MILRFYFLWYIIDTLYYYCRGLFSKFMKKINKTNCAFGGPDFMPFSWGCSKLYTMVSVILRNVSYSINNAIVYNLNEVTVFSLVQVMLCPVLWYIVAVLYNILLYFGPFLQTYYSAYSFWLLLFLLVLYL